MIKAVVTGHTQGLGAAIARELLGRGIAVLGVARGHLDLENIEQVALDLSNAGALLRWVDSGALAAYLAGSTRALLINNAGVVTPIGPLGAQDPAAAMQAAVVNVGAPLALSAAFVRAAPGIERRILHVSSGAARNPYAGWSVYGGTKAALDLHARGIAEDGDPLVRACALAPGVIDTNMQAVIRGSSSKDFPSRPRFVELANNGELTSPEECARRLVDYLLAASFGDTPVDDLRRRRT